MKYIDFKNRQHTIPVRDFIVYGDDCRKRSSLHLLARKILNEYYPLDAVLEEVTIKANHAASSTFYMDFIIPKQKLVIEVQGEQHYKFNQFHFKTNADFAKAQYRDRIKVEWCELNNLRHVELPYNESEEQWRDRIRKPETRGED